MNQTNQLYTNSCKRELVGVVLTSCNKIDVINIPIGVKVYIGLDEILDTRRDYLVDNKLYLKQNDVFAEAEKLFLHTIGTANEDLKLTLTTVGTNGKYFENIKKESLQLEDKTNELLYDTKIANELMLSILDKTINPYSLGLFSSGDSNTTSLIKMIDKTLSCDKIEIKVSLLGTKMIGATYTQNIYALLDGKPIANAFSNTQEIYNSSNGLSENTIFNCFGKRLEIFSMTSSADVFNYYNLQESTLKI